MDDNYKSPWKHLIRTRLIERSPGEDSKMYRARMNEDIHDLSQALLRAVALYNAETNLLSLPDELLTEIFLYVRDDAASRLDLPTKTSGSVLNSIMACRRLRQVILGSATLHASLSTSSHSLKSIKRGFLLSKGLPIRLEVLCPSNYEALDEDIRLHGFRVRSLTLILSDSICRAYASAWWRQMPSVSTLELRARLPRTHQITLFSTPESNPRLSSLSLDGVFTDSYKHNIYGSVRSLHLANITFNRHHGNELASLFTNCNVLEELMIKNSRVDHIAHSPGLEMPSSLRDFTYCGADVDHFRIIEIIMPSPSVHLKLVCTALPDQHVNVESCLPVRNKWLTCDLRPETVTIRFSHNDTSKWDAQYEFWRRSEDALALRDPDFDSFFYVSDTTAPLEVMGCEGYLFYVRHLTFTFEVDVQAQRQIFSSWARVTGFMSTKLQSLTLILLCEDIADVESQKGLLGCLGELYWWLNCRHEKGRAPITINTTAHVAALLEQDSGVVERSWYYKPDKTTKLSDMVSQVNIMTARDVRGN